MPLGDVMSVVVLISSLYCTGIKNNTHAARRYSQIFTTTWVLKIIPATLWNTSKHSPSTTWVLKIIPMPLGDVMSVVVLISPLYRTGIKNNTLKSLKFMKLPLPLHLNLQTSKYNYGEAQHKVDARRELDR